MQQNPDRRALPPGCVTHFDAQRGRWYYVHLFSHPPRVTFIHPADETPPSPQSLHVPPQSSTPQLQHQATTSFGQAMHNSASPSQQPLNFTNSMPTPIQTSTVHYQQQPIRPSISPIQDYAPQQQQNPSPIANIPSTFAMHRSRAPSESQSIYSASVPQPAQTPPDSSRFSIYTTSSNVNSQEMEFDPSILYSSPMSASPPSVPSSNSTHAMSATLQPQRRQVPSPNGRNSFVATSTNQATTHARSQSAHATLAVEQRHQPHNVLRRKAKTTSSFSAVLGKSTQPTLSVPKLQDVPTYNLVAQAPLESGTKPATPAFQAQLFSKPLIAPAPNNSSPTSNQTAGTQQSTSYTQAQPNQITQRTTSNHVLMGSASTPNMSTQGFVNSQFPSSMRSNQLIQPSIPATTAGPLGTAPLTTSQPPLSPLRAQATGHSVVPSASLMNSLALSPTSGLSNGMMAPSLSTTPLATNQTSSLMPTQPQLGGFANGTTGPPMSLPFNQPQLLMSSQLNGLSNGTMTGSPPTIVTPTSLMTSQPQVNNSFPNGMLMANVMAQPSLPAQHPNMNMLANGYGPGIAPNVHATHVQGGMMGQTPGGMGQPMANNVAQQKPQPPPKDDKSKQVMKKVGLSVGKAVLRFGTKFALESIGVDETVAGAAASLTASGAAAAAEVASSSK